LKNGKEMEANMVDLTKTKTTKRADENVMVIVETTNMKASPRYNKPKKANNAKVIYNYALL
jgi:xylose isomerase